MKLKKPTLIEDWKKQLKSYSALSLFAIFLTSLGYGLSLAFGAGLVYLSTTQTFVVISSIALMGLIGRFIRQTSKKDEEDVQ
jgi:hypothetical protein